MKSNTNRQTLQWLYGELPNLVNKGVLTSEAAQKIHQHYGDLKSTNKKRFTITLFSILGVLLIGLGIILLLAHNWEQLSRPIRALISLAPLIIGQALAFWVLLKRPTSHTLRESTATFVSLMVGAAIALISQTYNIPGNMADFIFSWMLLIIPLVYLMEATSPALIYVSGITAWVLHYSYSPQQAIIFWPLLAMVIPHFIWSLYKNEYKFRSEMLAIVIAISICLGSIQMAISLQKIWSGFGLVIYSSIATLFYSLRVYNVNDILMSWRKPIYHFGKLAIIVAIFLLTYRSIWNDLIREHQFTATWDLAWSLFLNCFLALLLIIATIWIFLGHIKQKRITESLFSALPILIIIGYIFGIESTMISALLFNSIMLTVSATQITTGIRTHSLSAINTGMLLFAILVSARFFDSNISFIVRGLSFIGVGVIFLITNVIIIRQKKGAP